MAAIPQQLTIEQGATFAYALDWYDSEDAPIHLVDCTAKMQIRAAQNPTSLLLGELSTTSGSIVLKPGTGKIYLNMSASQTAALNFTKAYYDLVVLFPGGHIERLINGKVTLAKGVTV